MSTNSAAKAIILFFQMLINIDTHIKLLINLICKNSSFNLEDRKLHFKTENYFGAQFTKLNTYSPQNMIQALIINNYH